jgi:hypothetical protein
MGTADFLFNCFVLGDDKERVFPLKALRNDNVGILKKLIKEEKSRTIGSSLLRYGKKSFAAISTIDEENRKPSWH